MTIDFRASVWDNGSGARRYIADRAGPAHRPRARLYPLGVRNRQRSGIDRVLPKGGAQRRIPRGTASRGRSALTRVTTRAVLPVAAVGGLAALSLAVPAASAVAPVASTAHLASARPIPAVGGPVLETKQFPAPITTAQCQAELGIKCYTPVQYRVAYDLEPAV